MRGGEEKKKVLLGGWLLFFFGGEEELLRIELLKGSEVVGMVRGVVLRLLRWLSLFRFLWLVRDKEEWFFEG